MIQPYDYIMLAVLAAAALYGAWKGMAWQLASLASIVVSAAVAVHGSRALAKYFGQQEPWNRFLAMLVLFVATGAAIWLLFRLVSGIIDRVKLKEFDRQLGVIFGLAKGVLYCVVITFFAVTLSEPARQAVLRSRSGDFIARGIQKANPVLPEDVRTWLGKYIDELDQKLHEPPKQVPAAPIGPNVPQTGADRGEGATTTTGEAERPADQDGDNKALEARAPGGQTSSFRGRFFGPGDRRPTT